MGSVAPEIFQSVKPAFFDVENVDDYLHVIEHDPLAGGNAIDGYWSCGVLLLQLRLNLTRDGF